MTGSFRKKSVIVHLLSLTFLVSALSVSVVARLGVDVRPGQVAAGEISPAYCLAKHDVGKLVVGVNNNGTFGTGYSRWGAQDCFTGETVPYCEYPKGSGTRYLYGAAFWIGAVVGADTLVSTGFEGYRSATEFHPGITPFGDMIYRSTLDPAKPEYEGAISEQDYIAVYTDTFTRGVDGVSHLDYLDGRTHIPLNIEITQHTYAWSYSYTEDFVLFDLSIKNIGDQRLSKLYMGLRVDNDVNSEALAAGGQIDDVCGFLERVPAHYLPQKCSEDEFVNLAWIADNDGDLSLSPQLHVPNVTGVRVVRTPADSVVISFNWWVSGYGGGLDFGPQTRAKARDLGPGGSGAPYGDRNRYHLLSNGEFDFDQMFAAAISPLDTIWVPYNDVIAADVADGWDTYYLLSFGPFDIDPGQALPLTFAYIAGENLHTNPDNISHLTGGNPDAYYAGLDFSDFGLNAIWADWIYDNPGVDTDGDGDSGVFLVCNLGGDSTLGSIDTVLDTLGGFIDTTIDTTWEYQNSVRIARRGDGVPDFRGASPPPAPILQVYPEMNAITVRWNGAHSETTPDNFTQEIEFEGYRVYLARDERHSSFSVLQSYDLEDYNKWVWDDSVVSEGRLGAFVLKESPLTLQELRCQYAPNGCDDVDWFPLDYTRSRPYVYSSGGIDSVFHFESQDYNQSILANYPNNTTDIRKRFPSAEMPSVEWIDDTTLIPDSLRSSVLTEGGYFKFYEYEYILENMLPTVPYWINVTAFDHGSPQLGLPSLETSPTVNPTVTYASTSTETVQAWNKLDVHVYPNPYRRDAGYRTAGFEGRLRDERDRPDDRVRRIHFGNLPPRCTIRIYSLDGDLVRELDHDIDPSDPLSNHDTWDLITRNTQLVVSGLYYWTVENPKGETQIGKFVIIM